MDGSRYPYAVEEVVQCHPEALERQVAHAHDEEHEQELGDGRQNKVPYDRHEHAVLFRQMAECHAQIDEQHGGACQEQQPDNRLYGIEQRIRIAGKGFPDACQHVAEPDEHLRARTDNADAQHGRSNADDAHNRRNNGLGPDVLGDRHRQGEHQVAFVTQQALIEPLDQDDLGHHEYSYHHAEVQQSQQRRRNAVHQRLHLFFHGQAVDERQQQHRRIHRQADARARLPLIFQQLQHANTSRNSISTDFPCSSRMASTLSCRVITPFLRNTTSSSTRSMSAIRWVDSSTDASSL